MKVVIVGGVAGGASAAARLRRLNENADIVLFERGEHISFANCGLPYYIGNVIKEKNRLLVQTPEAMKKRFNINVKTKSEVMSIDRKNKSVTVKNTESGQFFSETYDKLILSPGAEPIKPPIEGTDLSNVFVLRNIPDTYKIKEFAENSKPRRAVVVGGGFIGIEMAENLLELGIKVSIVEFANQVITPMDYEIASILHQHIIKKGVDLVLNNGLSKITKSDEGMICELSGGGSITADMVILSIGVRPESRVAREAGLDMGINGSIKTDEHLRTSDPDIYAVGDAIEVKNFVTGYPVLIPLAGPANKQGRIAADNIAGRDVIFEGVQGSSVIKVFDMTAAFVGLNEKILKKEGIPYEKTYIHPLSKAGYYPGGSQITMKMLFSPDGKKILGAQAVGYEGVDKRIDVIATAQRLGAGVFDLEKLELCYAPPYSSAKDPVNMLGFTASNIIRQEMKVFHWESVDDLIKSNAKMYDVRTVEEFALGTLGESVNIPVDELRNRLSEFPKDEPVYLFCQVGLRGYIAQRILMENGYKDVYNLSGGYKLYNAVKENDRFKAEKKEETAKPAPEEKRPDYTCCGYEICGDKDKKCATITVDASGLQCPGPIMRVSQEIKKIYAGDRIIVTATDPAFASDIEGWCSKTGNKLLNVAKEGGRVMATIMKNEKNETETRVVSNSGNDKTMVVFSGDLDKAIASFIIANGAASMGRKVTMFFTFWGLNILRRKNHVKVKKDLISGMFGFMMPRGTSRLKLSKMNMGGMGAKMIKAVMKSKNVSSLDELIQSAVQNGVRLIACQMSMDVMGLKPEELIEGVEIGGVATFLSSAEDSDTNLFI